MEFSCIEIEKLSGYSYISKYIYKDRSLSLKAKGLLSLLFSLPADWVYSESGFTEINADGLSSVRSTIKELKEKEYFIVERTRNSNGQMGASKFKVFQMPYSLDRNSVSEPEFNEFATDKAGSNVRVEDVPVSIMSNYHLRDKELSLKAKGLLSLMFSLPPNWVFSEKNLATLCSDGVSSVHSTLQELKQHNYVTVEPKRDSLGKMCGSLYTIFRMPYNIPRKVSSTTCENPVADNPIVENPCMEKPKQDNPQQGNSTQTKTKLIKTINNKNSFNNNKQKEKIKYGKNKNVLLSLSEYNELISLYPDKFEKAINIASDNILNGAQLNNIYNYIVGIIEKLPEHKTIKLKSSETNNSPASYDLNLFKEQSTHGALVYKKKDEN